MVGFYDFSCIRANILIIIQQKAYFCIKINIGTVEK